MTKSNELLEKLQNNQCCLNTQVWIIPDKKTINKILISVRIISFKGEKKDEIEIEGRERSVLFGLQKKEKERKYE